MDLQFLRNLTEKPGPFATVYLDASHDTEDAARAAQLRWTEARSQLAEQGADEATLDALEGAVGSGEPAVGRAGRVLVGRGGEVLLDRTLPEPPAVPSARWEPLPGLLPMLVDQPEPVSAVIVRIDETGGEIFAAGPGAEPVPVEDVEGSEYLVHKVRAGGWSHLNMQERVEESWRRNTAEVAERVDRHVAATGARLLVIAGDPRSRSRLRDALGERAAGMAVELDHSGGADADVLAAAVAEAVQDAVTDDRRAVLERYDQAAGRPDGLAVDGIERVLAALRAEAVDTLLVDGAVDRDTEVWISEVPTRLATSEDDLRAIGTDPTERVPVDAALLRAAACSGAAFVPVGGGRTGLVGRPMADGVAALLRYPLPSGA
ncbi:Rv2629 family ribosome hibernation factor [Pseudonocardia nigra]|uniref:Rv2629 family ribosome hibernation factor n=1 Tax=Pseudonocardia nigra TaxID=1921578 RepID=UPI001C5EDF4D|nr:Vms1/Ankzf1 family peptidyl-tRNA hydrolase [Pseudonocardia nigra]